MTDDLKNDLLNDKLTINFVDTIKRYPFNGRSKYLIDKFFIIGYDYMTLNKTFKKKNLPFLAKSSFSSPEIPLEKNISTLPHEFHIDEPPTLINEISSDYSKEVLDIDIIIEMIFPNKPNFYYIEERLEINKDDLNNSIRKIKTSKDLIFTKKPKTTNKEENSNISNLINSDKNNLDDDAIFNTYSNNKFNESETKATCNEEYIPSSYNVVFSSNPQSEGNSKKSINGFAHIFYKKFNEKVNKMGITYSFYVPVVFCIISEFPYYNSFYQLTRQIMLLFNDKIIEVPIEIQIQNIVSYVLSPINNDVILNIGSLSFINLWHSESAKMKSIEEEKIEEKIKIKEVQPFTIDENIFQENNEIISEKAMNQTPNINENNKQEIKKPNKKIKNEFMFNKSPNNMHKSLKMKSKNTKIPNGFRASCKDRKALDFLKQFSQNSNQKFVKKGEENDIKIKPIKFNFLPGYPLLQYNLSKVLLKKLSTYDVIQIFLYTFLEKDVIIFSSNLELLSLTLNSFQNLNFPLNDEKYYFINASVSYDNYIKGNSTFVGSAFTTMVGINHHYQPKYINSTSHKLKEHLAIDLDNGYVYQVKDPNDTDNSNNHKLLFDIIKKITKSKEIKEEKESKTILEREIKALNKELNRCIELILNDDRFKEYKLIDYNDQIHEVNLLIQESFYRFINNICIYFYQNISISTSNEKDKKSGLFKIELEFDNKYMSNDYTSEEKYFLDELRDTMKFQSFIYGFIQSYNPINLYKIPLTFTEEFVSILSRKSNLQLKNIQFLKLFDNLYRKIEPGKIEIDFKPFMSKYFIDYKEIFDREIQDYNTEEKKRKNKFNLSNFMGQKKAFNFNYTWYELDNNLIVKYLDLMKNLDPKEYSNLFPVQLFDLENNIIKEVLISDIENEVENYAIESNFLSKNDILASNILLLFTLTLKLVEFNDELQQFLISLLHGFVIFRKYYSIIINMIYKLMEECIKNKQYSKANNYLLLYYPCINSINQNRLVPNENLFNTIKKFDSLNINSLFEKIQESKDDINNDNPINKIDIPKIDQNNLYICYNFTRNGTISEEKIVNEINKDIEKFNQMFSKNIKPKIIYKMGEHIIESQIYPQKELLKMLTNEYNLFNKDLDTKKISSKIMVYACMNTFIFMRNNKENNSGEDFIKIIEIIFNIYLKKYLEEKEAKDKEEKVEKELTEENVKKVKEKEEKEENVKEEKEIK